MRLHKRRETLTEIQVEPALVRPVAGSLSLVFGTIWVGRAALAQLRQEGYLVRDEDVVRLSPFVHE